MRINDSRSRSSNRRGLTLIELTVVLLILVALAGILVPQLTGYLERAHTAGASTNLGEITKYMETYNVKYLKGYPDGLDSLMNTAGALYTKLTPAAQSVLSVGPLDAGQLASLNNIGITAVHDMKLNAAFPTAEPWVPSATFGDEIEGPYAAARTAPRTLAVGANAAVFLSGAQASAQLGADPTGTYVVFGLGGRNTAIGKVMVDAPLHFDQVDPNQVYQRYFVVFSVPATGAVPGTTSFKARFIGTLGAEATGLGEHLGEYFQSN